MKRITHQWTEEAEGLLQGLLLEHVQDNFYSLNEYISIITSFIKNYADDCIQTKAIGIYLIEKRK